MKNLLTLIALMCAPFVTSAQFAFIVNDSATPVQFGGDLVYALTVEKQPGNQPLRLEVTSNLDVDITLASVVSVNGTPVNGGPFYIYDQNLPGGLYNNGAAMIVYHMSLSNYNPSIGHELTFRLYNGNVQMDSEVVPHYPAWFVDQEAPVVATTYCDTTTAVFGPLNVNIPTTLEWRVPDGTDPIATAILGVGWGQYVTLKSADFAGLGAWPFEVELSTNGAEQTFSFSMTNTQTAFVDLDVTARIICVDNVPSYTEFTISADTPYALTAFEGDLYYNDDGVLVTWIAEVFEPFALTCTESSTFTFVVDSVLTLTNYVVGVTAISTNGNVNELERDVFVHIPDCSEIEPVLEFSPPIVVTNSDCVTNIFLNFTSETSGLLVVMITGPGGSYTLWNDNIQEGLNQIPWDGIIQGGEYQITMNLFSNGVFVDNLPELDPIDIDSCVTSITEIDPSDGPYGIYPNPIDRGYDLTVFANEDLFIQIFDARHRLVYDSQIGMGQTMTIGTGAFASGVYLLNSTSIEGEFFQQKLAIH